MDNVYFCKRLRDIYAIFCKAYPPEHVSDAIFERVSDLPDVFMDFAKKQIQDEQTLHVNLGRYFVKDVLPSYQATLYQSQNRNQAGCPRCADSPVPGLLYWTKGIYDYAKPCSCDASPCWRDYQGLSDAELEDAGYVRKRRGDYSFDSTSETQIQGQF